MPTKYEPIPASTNPQTEWDYTIRARKLVAERQRGERGRGEDQRPTIGRDMPIRGGIYEGTYGGEKIYVKREDILSGVAAVVEAAQSDGRFDKNLALYTTFNYVKGQMKYSQKGVEEIFQEHGGVDGEEVPLGEYIAKGVGECRHQSLYVGAILEEFRAAGAMNGKASVERNRQPRPDDDKYDGHSWVRYTTGGGQVYILDVAQNCIGTLEELMRRRREGDDTVWDYGRLEDHKRVRAQMALEAMERENKWAPAENRKPLQRESRGSVETDKNGLIMLPDWLLAHKTHEQAAQRANNPTQDEPQSVQSVEKPKTDTEKFYEAQAKLVETIQRDIARAGSFDPCSAAFGIAGDIEKIMRIQGLNPELTKYLEGVKGICIDIGNSGNDRYSPYYRKQGSGLRSVLAKIQAIE